MKPVNKVNIIFCSILIVLLTSCSLKVHEPERLELIYLQKNIIDARFGKENNDMPPRDLLSLLENTLKDIGLPKDYIAINIINSTLPLCYVGISREMYISNSMIKDFNAKEIGDNEMKAILIHEISHKIKDHPYSLISTLSFDWEYRKMDESLALDIVKLGITAAASYFVINKLKSHSLKSSLLSQAANLQLPLPDKKPEYKQLFAAYFNPLTGFNYPLEYEYEADLLAVEKLQKIGLTKEVLIQALRKQIDYLNNYKRIYMNESSDEHTANGLQQRLENLHKN